MASNFRAGTLFLWCHINCFWWSLVFSTVPMCLFFFVYIFIFKCVYWSIGMVLQSMKKHKKKNALSRPPHPQVPSTLDETAHTCTKMDLRESNVKMCISHWYQQFWMLSFYLISLDKRIYCSNTTLDDPCKCSFYLACVLLTKAIELESLLHNVVHTILSGILQSCNWKWEKSNAGQSHLYHILTKCV